MLHNNGGHDLLGALRNLFWVARRGPNLAQHVPHFPDLAEGPALAEQGPHGHQGPVHGLGLLRGLHLEVEGLN